MIYLEYEEYKSKYHKAQKKSDEILSEKEELFNRTQPKATTYDKELVSGGMPSNTFDDYLIIKEKKMIEERLEEAKSILEDRERLFKLKEEELRNSKDWYDIVYTYRYLDNLKPDQIKCKMPYCRSSIYEILKKINKSICLDKNGQKI